MIKAALGSSDAFLLAAACHAASRESLPSTILECNGTVLPVSTGLPKGEADRPMDDDALSNGNRAQCAYHPTHQIRSHSHNRNLRTVQELKHRVHFFQRLRNRPGAVHSRLAENDEPLLRGSPWYKKHKGSSEFHLMSIRVDG